MKDPLNEFLELFDQGNVLDAVRLILPNPDSSYDHFQSIEPLFPIIINYVDAGVFFPLNWSFGTITNFINIIEKYPHLTSRFQKALDLLKLEQSLLAYMCERINASFKQDHPTLVSYMQSILNEVSLTPDEIDKTIVEAPESYRRWLALKIDMSQGWLTFKQAKPALASLLSRGDYFSHHPSLPLSYHTPLNAWSLNDEEIPLVFLQPLESDLSLLKKALENRVAIFICESFGTFCHLLRFPEIVEMLIDPNHLIYLLDQYPNLQFTEQPWYLINNKGFQPIFALKRDPIERALPALKNCLKHYFEQSKKAFEQDSPLGDGLYHLAQKLLFSIQEERLGLARAPALTEHYALLKWFDHHKGRPPKGMDLGPEPKDLMGIKLTQLAQEPVSQKRIPQKGKIRLAHVVALIVDGTTHAPSQLVENLILNHDREVFEIILIVTERHSFHPFEYPPNYRYSDTSKQRGAIRLAKFKSEDVAVFVLDNYLYYEEAAQICAALLSQLRVDAVVFHGPDVINNMCAQLTDVPTRILFEHGTQPSYPGYDAVVVSSEDAVDIYRQHFDKLHTKVKVLPFAVDIRSGWLSNPYSRMKLGLPEDSLLMTTISNHLANRLSNGMCLAIAEILKRVPKAYYTPIGEVNSKSQQQFKDFFKSHGVENRVIFLGSLENPSQYTRSMHLYLNEFPFGSCLALLDAMAAGCPVVSMYDINGPQQARYGGDYFGIDRTVKSVEEYVDLAYRLLTNTDMYEEWSNHAKQRYEEHADVKGYVKRFEGIILKQLDQGK